MSAKSLQSFSRRAYIINIPVFPEPSQIALYFLSSSANATINSKPSVPLILCRDAKKDFIENRPVAVDEIDLGALIQELLVFLTRGP